MKFIALVFLFALTSVNGSSGQPSQPSRLRELSVDKYIASVDTVLNDIKDSPDRDETYNFNGILTFYSLIEWEFNLRYAQVADWQTLLAMYDTLDGERTMFGHYTPYVYPELWYPLILNQWLSENPTDFSLTPQITFGPMTIWSIELGPDSNGEVAYMLDASRLDDIDRYGQVFLAKPSDDPTGYEISPFPLPIRSGKYSPSQFEWAGPMLSEQGDLNRDGFQEFVFELWAALPASWTSASYKQTVLIGWDGETITTLVVAETHAENFEYRFQNTDTDEELEWVQVEYMEDNWGCEWQIETVFDRDGQQYVKHPALEKWALSLNCALRDAEAGMSVRDYSKAISAYKLAVERFEAEINPSPEMRHYAAYSNERLVIAYALSGRIDDALLLLNSLTTAEYEGDTLASAMHAAAQTDSSAVSLCITAYETMQRITRYNSGRGTDLYRELPILGYTEDLFYGLHLHEAGSPEATACNAPALTMPPTPTPTPYPTYTPEPTVNITPKPYINYQATLYPLFKAQAYDTAAEVASEAIQNEPSDAFKTTYMRAVALELAGDSTAAAIEYYNLTQAEDAFPYNMLSAIHLEPVQTN